MARLTTTGLASAYVLSSTIQSIPASDMSFPSSISADYAGNIWITSTAVADTSGGTSVFKIATGSSATAAAVSGLTFSNLNVGAPSARMPSYCLIKTVIC